MKKENNEKFDNIINTLIRGLVFLIIAMSIIWFASNIFSGLMWLFSGLATIVGTAFIILAVYITGKRLIEKTEKK